jgi:tetratricopeptide (TPR) repeat protein
MSHSFTRTLTRALAAAALVYLLIAGLSDAVAAARATSDEAAPADSKWLDVEGRIQYGYYTEDARSLEALANQLATGDSSDAMKSYFSALADYRITLLASSRDKSRAREYAEKCASSADRAVQDHDDFPDGLALQSACLAQVADLSTLRAALAGPKSRSQMAKAMQLATRNPRVLLLDAVGAYERAAKRVDRDAAIGKLKKAVAALEAERQEVVHVPGWGLAEGYAYLARAYLDRGEPLAARDALEHALLAAPEYAQARRMMSQITSG